MFFCLAYQFCFLINHPVSSQYRCSCRSINRSRRAPRLPHHRLRPLLPFHSHQTQSPWQRPAPQSTRSGWVCVRLFILCFFLNVVPESLKLGRISALCVCVCVFLCQVRVEVVLWWNWTACTAFSFYQLKARVGRKILTLRLLLGYYRPQKKFCFLNTVTRIVS